MGPWRPYLAFFHRPESVGEGTHRLFVSKNLQEADGTLAKRLFDTVNTVASGVASLSRRSRPGPNKTRMRDTQRAYGFAVEGPVSQAAHQVVPSHAASTSRAVSVNQPTLTSDGLSVMELSLEGEIASIVLLLKCVACFLVCVTFTRVYFLEITPKTCKHMPFLSSGNSFYPIVA
jgi:hypothetical protein